MIFFFVFFFQSFSCQQKNFISPIISTDKFDQFWAVNRRLMEPIGEQDGFKHIPIRCYNEVRIFFFEQNLLYS